MRKASLLITVDPDSELGRAPDERAKEPVVLVHGELCVQVTREAADPWATPTPHNFALA